MVQVSFWGIVVEEKRMVRVHPRKGLVLNIQMVALETTKTEPCDKCTLYIEVDQKTHVLCTLRPMQMENVKLDLVFGSDKVIKFGVSGTGRVHLTGYYQPGPVDDEDGEGDNDQAVVAVTSTTKKQKKKQKKRQKALSPHSNACKKSKTTWDQVGSTT